MIYIILPVCTQRLWDISQGSGGNDMNIHESLQCKSYIVYRICEIYVLYIMIFVLH